MFSASSDPFLFVAFWTGVSAVTLVFVVAFLIVWLRLDTLRRRARWQRFLAAWRPRLIEALIAGDKVTLPHLPRSDRRNFLKLWTYLHESVRGDAAAGLDHAATMLGMDAHARHLLVSGSRGDKLLSIVVVGHLRDRLAWNALQRMTHSTDGLLAVNAARAMVQIEPYAAAQALMPLILSRRDWDVARVGTFLAEARQAFWLLLVKSVQTMRPRDLPPALRLAESLRLQLPLPTLRYLLAPDRAPAVICGALRLANQADLATSVRRCLAHRHWRVREQAVRQMAILGGPDDVPHLVGLLEDASWPVRIGAARALVQLPYYGIQELIALQQRGAPADDILRHVIAENVPA